MRYSLVCVQGVLWMHRLQQVESKGEELSSATAHGCPCCAVIWQQRDPAPGVEKAVIQELSIEARCFRGGAMTPRAFASQRPTFAAPAANNVNKPKLDRPTGPAPFPPRDHVLRQPSPMLPFREVCD